MIDVFATSSSWRKVRQAIDDRESAVMIAPRDYGAWTYLEHYVRTEALHGGVTCVRLSSRDLIFEGQADYGQVWDAARGQLGGRATKFKVDRTSFIHLFETAVAKSKNPVLALVAGAGRRNEQNHYHVLATFHRMLVNSVRLKNQKLTILASEDYSLFLNPFAGREAILASDDSSTSSIVGKPHLESDLYTYKYIHFSHMDRDEIAACVRGVGGVDTGRVDEIAETVHAVTGGHPGLVREVLEDLHEDSWSLPVGVWHEDARGRLKKSAVLESLSKALGEDLEGYSKTALEYRKPAIPELSIRIDMLRQLGVLQREIGGTVQLCQGVITTLMENIAARHVGGNPRVGRILNDPAPSVLFEPGPIVPTDEDLVILHLSDLHIGKEYRHRLTWKGGEINSYENTAGELLRDDLNPLGLRGKVDGLVISGDLISQGATSEKFDRAKDAIEEIREAIGLRPNQILFIPGNHDICRDPAEFASRPEGRQTSLADYERFLLLMGKRPGNPLETLELVNRAGTAQLRILGLDSNHVEGPKAPGVGYVSPESFLAAKSYLEREDATATPDRRTYTWITVHHHIFPASSTPLARAQKKEITVMGNATTVLNYANEWGVELVLHGHEHQPSVTVVRRWPVDGVEAFRPLISVGAGSFGSVRNELGPFGRNQYYIIYRRPDRIIIRSRQQGDGGVKFIPHGDLQIPR